MKDKMSTTIVLLGVIAGLLGIIVIQNFANLGMNHRAVELHENMMDMHRADMMMDRAYNRYMLRKGYMDVYPNYDDNGVTGEICPLINEYMDKYGVEAVPVSVQNNCMPMMGSVESNVADNIDGSASVPMPTMGNLEDGFANEEPGTVGASGGNMGGALRLRQ